MNWRPKAVQLIERKKTKENQWINTPLKYTILFEHQILLPKRALPAVKDFRTESERNGTKGKAEASDSNPDTTNLVWKRKIRKNVISCKNLKKNYSLLQ